MSREVMQKVLSSLMNLQPIIANGLLDKRQLAFIDPHLDVACEALIAELAKPERTLTDEEIDKLMTAAARYRKLVAMEAELVEPITIWHYLRNPDDLDTANNTKEKS